MTTSRSFTLLCTVGVFCFISYNMVRMPVLALFAESLGASPERIGLIVSVSTLTGVFLKLPSGALSDIYGRRYLLQIGVIAFGLPPFLYPWVTDLDTLTGLRMFHGLAAPPSSLRARWLPWQISIGNGGAPRSAPIRPRRNSAPYSVPSPGAL